MAAAGKQRSSQTVLPAIVLQHKNTVTTVASTSGRSLQQRLPFSLMTGHAIYLYPDPYTFQWTSAGPSLAILPMRCRCSW